MMIGEVHLLRANLTKELKVIKAMINTRLLVYHGAVMGLLSQ
jgi:hypothetical protein